MPNVEGFPRSEDGAARADMVRREQDGGIEDCGTYPGMAQKPGMPCLSHEEHREIRTETRTTNLRRTAAAGTREPKKNKPALEGRPAREG
jgi:hypothetical protein